MSTPNGCGSIGAVVGTCGKDENLLRLQDTMYREHLNELAPNETKNVDDVMSKTLYFALTNVNFNFDDHIAQLMKVGSAGVEVMDKLLIATQDKGIYSFRDATSSWIS